MVKVNILQLLTVYVLHKTLHLLSSYYHWKCRHVAVVRSLYMGEINIIVAGGKYEYV